MVETKQRRLSDRARARLGWWLPPLLGVLAVLFQYAFDVPKAEMLQRPNKKERKAEKKKQNDKIRKLNRERAKQAKRWEGRSADEVAALRREWMTEPIADEPEDYRFRRHHEALLRSLVTRARTKVLDGAKPVPIQIRPKCKTLRCTLELCGPSSLIDPLAEILPTAKVQPKEGPEGPLFLELRALEPEHRPKVTDEPQICRRWLTTFDRDDTQIRDLKL